MFVCCYMIYIYIYTASCATSTTVPTGRRKTTRDSGPIITNIIE